MSARLGGIASTRAIVAACSGWRRRGVAVERVDRRQPGVAGPEAVAALLLEVVEERADQRRVEVGEVQPVGCLPVLCCGEVEQQPDRVAVGGDRVRAGVALGISRSVKNA